MQSATLHKFSTARPSSLHLNGLPLGFLDYKDHLSTEADKHPFIQEGSGAWDITPGTRPAFCFCHPFRLWLPSFGRTDPDPTASYLTGQEPIPTFRSSNGCLALRPTKSARRLALSDESAVFQSLVACLPYIRLVAEWLLSTLAPFPSDWWFALSCLNLALPPFQTKIAFSRTPTAKRRCV